ncbi:MAG: NIPSNAP family protein, partial [Myxococcota bacterium]|nr:NIPSNAP family protein [Myxococcota bacterium]
HELVQVKPGRSPEFLEHVRDTAIAAHAPHGMQLVGAFETAMRNDSECLVIWAIENWSAWAAYERKQRSDEGLLTWRSAIRDVAIDWQRTLLVEAEFSPMRIGRQPEIGDRRKLEDV